VNRIILKDDYLIINLVFAGVILAIIGYAVLFSAEEHPLPVPSGAELLYNEPVISTGLSRSFSEIVRFHFTRAQAYNPYGIRLFSFFAVQLILRMVASLVVIKSHMRYKRLTIIVDIVFSVALFLVCFWPVIAFSTRQFFCHFG
jgi:hypothetical protein